MTLFVDVQDSWLGDKDQIQELRRQILQKNMENNESFLFGLAELDT